MTTAIELTKGYVAYVDPVDADLVSEKWHAHASNTNGSVFAARLSYGELLILGRVVLERIIKRKITNKEQCSYANGNSLDCTRANVFLTYRGDCRHKGDFASQTNSGFKGVYLDKRRNKWKAYIHVHRQPKFLGYFNTAEAGHEAHCKAAAELRGELARRA